MSAYRWLKLFPATTWLTVSPCRSLRRALRSAEGHRWAGENFTAASRPMRWSKVSSRRACRSHRTNSISSTVNSSIMLGIARKEATTATYLPQTAKSRSCHTRSRTGRSQSPSMRLQAQASIWSLRSPTRQEEGPRWEHISVSTRTNWRMATRTNSRSQSPEIARSSSIRETQPSSLSSIKP